jgi:hypothetical protein
LTNWPAIRYIRQLIPDFEREMLRRFETTHPAAKDIPRDWTWKTDWIITSPGGKKNRKNMNRMEDWS